MKSQRIPPTDSIDELAKFWDNHDLTNFEDQLEEVTTPVFHRREPAQVVSINLQPDEAEALERIAKTKGMQAGALIHHWVAKKLNQLL